MWTQHYYNYKIERCRVTTSSTSECGEENLFMQNWDPQHYF